MIPRRKCHLFLKRPGPFIVDFGKQKLGGGFKDFSIFSSLFGEDEPILTHNFQKG